jgi:hypothetical protein
VDVRLINPRSLRRHAHEQPLQAAVCLAIRRCIIDRIKNPSSSGRARSVSATPPRQLQTYAPDASSSRQKQQSIPGEVSEKKPPSDAKLGASSTLPFADWHSKYSQNVRMSTAAQKNLQPGKYLSPPDKPLLRYTHRPFSDAFSVTNLGELAPCRACRDWSGPQTGFWEVSRGSVNPPRSAG